MQKYVFGLVFLLVPTVAMAQGITVTSVLGHVEVTPASGQALIQVDSASADALPKLNIGDEVRTGPSGQMTLEMPDGSYILISENTTLKIEQYWGSSVRNLMRVMLGKVRFHIQKLGGRPNPYRINTPTALIAVRGTDFDVRVDDSGEVTEVRTFDGRVTVLGTTGDTVREVVLDRNHKTLVREGQHPTMPVGLEEEFGTSRTLQVVRKDGEQDGAAPLHARSIPNAGVIGNDNDRRNRIVDPLVNPNLNNRPSTTILRGKLSYPR